ncbi:TPA: phage baseplate protein, partial [Serratia marcescens]|nr:phage baseplate protein [Serratia marcescens]HEN7413328.1 phage baseplate protein [Serratia marcescens]
MPFNRPTLTELRAKNRTQLQAELKKTGALLRYSNMRVLVDADAGLAHLHYGYLDYIAL